LSSNADDSIAPVALPVAEVRSVLGHEVVARPLATATNARLWRLEGGPRPLVAKQAPPGDDGARRVARERAFSVRVWASGERRIPEPVAVLPEHNIVVMGAVEGRPISAPTEAVLRDAWAFWRALRTITSDGPPPASTWAADAAFTHEDHVDRVRARLERLEALDVDHARGAAALLADLRRHLDRASQEGADAWAPTPPAPPLLSPSDFGLHNALLRPSGPVCFLDFEHAGWDGPEKLLCDTFLHPRVPLPLDAFDDAAAALASSPSATDDLRRRALAVYELHRIKWACLALSPLDPEVHRRRIFAGHTEVVAEAMARAHDLLSNTERPDA
jgi:hypothetical protein